MNASDAVIAVFADHGAAEAAVRKLRSAGFSTETLSVLGKAYDRGEKVVGFFNSGGQIRFWGERGDFWGRLWRLFSGGLFVTVPVVGPVIVLGHLATTAMFAVEGAVGAGGLSAINAALSDIGIPKESVLQYEFAVKADGFLVMAHGVNADTVRAHAILLEAEPARLDMHSDHTPAEPTAHPAAVGF